MKEKSPKEINHTETFKKWLIKNVVCVISGFCLGVLSTLILGRLILFTDFPEPIQKVLGRFYDAPFDLSGNYFYVTTTQNIPKLPVKCNDNSSSKVIAGIVNIQHKRTISNQSISLHGERIFCISMENKKSTLKRVMWNSTWAFIYGGKLYAKINIGDNKEGYIEDASVFNDREGFSAKTAYIWNVEESQRKRDIGQVNIEFTKCKPSKCEEELQGRLSKHQI